MYSNYVLDVLLNNYEHNDIKIKFKTIKQIIKDSKDIINELNIILKQKDGYKYNFKSKKDKKHFPGSININYKNHMNNVNKEINKNQNISFSLSSKQIEKQFEDILFTATRRFNFINCYDNNYIILNNLLKVKEYNLETCNPYTLRNNLIKYDNKEAIKEKFSSFSNKDRVYFDTVYSIKTENPHYYFHANTKKLCDTILICCNDKIFNIMFYLDEKNPYYLNLNDIEFPEKIIEEIYKNSNI